MSLLLVLMVLVGLVGMHGLAASALPGTASAAASESPRSASHSAHSAEHSGEHRVDGGRSAMALEEAAADSLCHHHSTGGHAVHAVTHCVATGVGTAYLPPAPARCPHAPASCVAKALRHTSVERAPPDLARLQLLRI